MTVEENLLDGRLPHAPAEPRPGRRPQRVLRPVSAPAPSGAVSAAGVLSGGERRLLEISRALIMEPDVLLVDEPSIGLEPRFIDMVFEILDDLQRRDGKTIVMVEQNAKKGLEFADIGYVLVAGQLALAGRGDELLDNPESAGCSWAGETFGDRCLAILCAKPPPLHVAALCQSARTLDPDPRFA